MDDLYGDYKFSTDIRQALEEILIILNIPYKEQLQHISGRWLSSYDYTVTVISMVDAFYLFYMHLMAGI